MTIDEAIKILSTAWAHGYTASLDGLDAASQLGIEALKRVRDSRRLNPMFANEQLPGETKD